MLTNTSEEFFPLNTPLNNDEFASRLKRYEDSSSDLISIMTLLGYWGTSDHLLSISIPAKQFALQLGKDTRSNKWTSLRLYPLVLLMYALGIGAVAANNYSILYNFFQTTFRILSYPLHGVPLVFAIEEGFRAARSSFNLLPDHQRDYSPTSEYLFNFFNNKFKDIVILGDEYEDVFDRFEIIYALQCAHEREKISGGHIWGPIGRFGWKYSRGIDSNPFSLLCDEALRKKESWVLLSVGFFDGSYERFEKLAAQYAQELKSIH